MKKRKKTLINLLSVLVIVLSIVFMVIHLVSSRSKTPADSGETVTTASQTDESKTETTTMPVTTTTQPTTEERTAAPTPVTTEKYDGAARYAAFTFDDGPNATITNEVLKVLKENNVRATFFILGQNAKEYPQIVKNIVNAGCEVGTHSYSHKNYSKLTAEEIKADLSNSIKTIEDISGTPVRLFRAPYGSYNSTVKESVNRPIILWSYDTRDWAYKIKKDDKRSAAQIEADKNEIVNKLLNSIRDGEIVLMHDMNKMTLDVCKDVIPKLVKDGWKIVSVSELAAMRGKELKNGTVYSMPIKESKST